MAGKANKRKVSPMVKRLAGAIGWLLDSLTRYVPDCAPIKFDDDRLAELNAQADAASVTYGSEYSNAA